MSHADIPLIGAINRDVSAAIGRPFRAEAYRTAGGGCINSAMVVEGGGERYFVKLNDARALAMFEAEAAGLAEIAQSRTIRVPAAICAGVHGANAYLVLEFLDLGRCDAAGAERLWRALAAMHRVQAKQFGWMRDNTIGSTPQINTRSDDWISFYGEYRLGFQLKLAGENGYGGRLRTKGERLIENLCEFFSTWRPTPSLLHGDLWGGNHGCLRGGPHDDEPVIFDPAVYYGDRETDIAMTELFGGFPPRFYSAYREAWPLDAGYGVRKTLYNLYHVLNHANLFGGGYAAQAESMIDSLLAEIG
jgi:fructosamine-3-kinase